jgi:spermidine/putrescine-binding protein
MYNPDRVEAPTSYTDLWNPKYRGRVAMHDVYFDAWAMTSVATGGPPSVEDGIKAWKPDGVVVAPPTLDEDSCRPQRVDDLADADLRFPNEQIVSQPRVEALDVAVLSRRTRGDVGGLRAHPP